MISRLARSAAAAALGLGVLAGIGASPAAANTIGNTEGCTPGYWKNHTSPGVWEEYDPARRLRNVFLLPARNTGGPDDAFTGAHPDVRAFMDTTMLQALQGGGGSGITGAARILFRAATAAYLNAAHEGIEFPYGRFEARNGNPSLHSLVAGALRSGDRAHMLAVADRLDQANNLGCPL